MKKSIKLFLLLLSLSTVMVFVACDKGEEIIIGDEIVVSDGIYILGSATSDTAATKWQMSPGFAGDPTPRADFYEAYAYLNAGSFNYVFYVDNVAKSYGGTFTSLPMADNATYNYGRGDLVENGAAINVPSAGLYHLHVDLTTNLFFLTKVEYFEIIGSATPDGWGVGQKLAVKSSSADEVVFEGTNIIIRGGEYKYRYNSSWGNDIDGVFYLHSNFGVDKVAGGPNIQFTDTDGVFTIAVTYTPGAGVSLAPTFTRTGDAPVITYSPADYPWGLIGAATPKGWGADTVLTYLDWAATWTGVFYLGADVFKFRADPQWAKELNPGNVILDADTAISDNGDGNFVNSTAGLYFFRISTADEGATWNLYVHPVSPGLIGDAMPNAWNDPDTDIPFVDEVAGTITWKITGVAMTAAGWKIRLNDGWEVSYGFNDVTLAGANAGLLSDSGGNFGLSTAGTYNVTLSTSDNGATYTVTFD